jgi:hypothetical protein
MIMNPKKITRQLTAAILCTFICFFSPFSGNAEEVQPCNPEPSVTAIAYGDFLSGPGCVISPVGDTDDCRFVASKGEVITVQVARSGVGTPGPCVELLGPQGSPTPNGKKVCRSGNGSVRITEAIGQDGEHTIRVSESGNNQTIYYNVVLERVMPLSPAALPLCSGCNLQGAIEGVGDIDLYYFKGSPGDEISTQVARSGVGSPGPCVQLFGPDGLPMANGKVCRSGKGAVTVNQTIQQAGMYVIAVTESGDDQTISYSVDLQCIGVCPETPRLPIGGTVTGFPPTEVTCVNETSGQSVVIRSGAPSFDCEAAGLVVNPGNTVSIHITGAVGGSNPGDPNPSDPHIEFTSVPVWGTSQNLKGMVRNLNPADFKVAVFIKVGSLGWWTKPYWNQPLTSVRADSTWETDVTTGGRDAFATEYVAYLVRNGYNPPLLGGQQSLPAELDQNAMAKVHTTRAP